MKKFHSLPYVQWSASSNCIDGIETRVIVLMVVLMNDRIVTRDYIDRKGTQMRFKVKFGGMPLVTY